MPNYDYRHRDEKGDECEQTFEVFQAMSDEPLTTCPKCGKPAQKVFSVTPGYVNRMSSSNLREKGFQRWVKRDKGVYERDT